MGSTSVLKALINKTPTTTIPTTTSKSKHTANKINYLVSSGRLSTAVSLLFSSPFPFPFPLYAHLFHLCATHKAIVETRKVESHLITYHDPPPTFLLNRAIGAYGKCGCLRDARELFDEMPFRDGGSWNALITAFSQGGGGNEVLKVFKEMGREGIGPNEVTFAGVLSSCAAVGELGFGRGVHGLVVKLGFGGNLILGSCLVDVYGKCKVMDDARKMFEEIECPNDVSWNMIVRRYFEVGDVGEAVSMFAKEVRAGVRPLNHTVSTALVACTSMLDVGKGVQIHGFAIKNKYDVDETVSTSLIDMYVKCGDLETARKVYHLPNNKNVMSGTALISGYLSSGSLQEAREIFDDMPERNILSWNTMLGGHVRCGQWDEAMSLILQLCDDVNRADHVTVNLMLNVSAVLSDIRFGKQIHAYIYRHGIHSDSFIGNSLINLYGKSGMLRVATVWFDQMRDWRNTVSWNSLMSAFARHQMSEIVILTFSELLKEKTPNEYTFTILLAACSNMFALRQGKEIHGFIIRNGYEMDDVVLGAMVDMYSKCRNLKYALRLFKSTATRDVIVWNSIISGCCHHGFPSEALKLFRLMKELKVEPDYVTFRAILNACVLGGYVDQGKKYFNAMSSEYYIMARLEHYECMVELYAAHGAMSDLDKFIRELPFDPTVSMLSRVVDACRKYGNPSLGKWAAKQLEKLNHPTVS